MEDCKPGLRRERDNNFIVTEAITLAGLGWAGLGWAGLGWAGLGWCDEMVTGSNQLGTMSRKGVSLQLHKHGIVSTPPPPATSHQQHIHDGQGRVSGLCPATCAPGGW